jgi:hypothetical protein
VIAVRRAFVGVTSLLLTSMTLACGGGETSGGPSSSSSTANSAPDAAPIGKDCKVSPGSGDVAFAQGRDFFCIAWRDTHTDEQAYRVGIKYLPSGEEFVYPVAANAVEHFLPQSDWPEDVRLQPGACICEVARKDFEVIVHAIRPSGEAVVGRLDIIRDATH